MLIIMKKEIFHMEKIRL